MAVSRQCVPVRPPPAMALQARAHRGSCHVQQGHRPASSRQPKPQRPVPATEGTASRCTAGDCQRRPRLLARPAPALPCSTAPCKVNTQWGAPGRSHWTSKRTVTGPPRRGGAAGGPASAVRPAAHSKDSRRPAPRSREGPGTRAAQRRRLQADSAGLPPPELCVPAVRSCARASPRPRAHRGPSTPRLQFTLHPWWKKRRQSRPRGRARGAPRPRMREGPASVPAWARGGLRGARPQGRGPPPTGWNEGGDRCTRKVHRVSGSAPRS